MTAACDALWQTEESVAHGDTDHDQHGVVLLRAALHGRHGPTRNHRERRLPHPRPQACRAMVLPAFTSWFDDWRTGGSQTHWRSIFGDRLAPFGPLRTFESRLALRRCWRAERSARDTRALLSAAKGIRCAALQPGRRIRSAVRSAQRRKGGARRAGDSRGAECAVGLIPHHAAGIRVVMISGHTDVVRNGPEPDGTLLGDRSCNRISRPHRTGC